jgi:hypothetical protein
MQKLLSIAVLGAALLVLGVTPATAAHHKGRSCNAADKAGNWEVILATASSSQAASRIVSRASAKGLHAKAERVGCSKRYEVEIAAATKSEAATMLAQARKDGFASAKELKS